MHLGARSAGKSTRCTVPPRMCVKLGYDLYFSILNRWEIILAYPRPISEDLLRPRPPASRRDHPGAIYGSRKPMRF